MRRYSFESFVDLCEYRTSVDAGKLAYCCGAGRRAALAHRTYAATTSSAPAGPVRGQRQRLGARASRQLHAAGGGASSPSSAPRTGAGGPRWQLRFDRLSRDVPHVKDPVVVHHAVERQVLARRYPKLFTESELHSLENLRGSNCERLPTSAHV